MDLYYPLCRVEIESSVQFKWSGKTLVPFRIIISDIQGKLLTIPFKRLSSYANQEIVIDISSLTNGLYFYTILNDDFITTGKFYKIE